MFIIFPARSKKNQARKLQPVPSATVVKPKRNKTKENLRTTLMLIIVCILFLITEFPQAILILFSIISGNPDSDDSFYKRIYTPLGDVLDMLALINNSINFLLYCTMSRAFRNTFYTIIMKVSCCEWLLAPCLPKDAKGRNIGFLTVNGFFKSNYRLLQQKLKPKPDRKSKPAKRAPIDRLTPTTPTTTT